MFCIHIILILAPVWIVLTIGYIGLNQYFSLPVAVNNNYVTRH